MIGRAAGVKRKGLLAALALFSAAAIAQSLDVHDGVKTFSGLTNTTVTMTGRAELRIAGTGDPLPGSVVHLNSKDAWLLLTGLRPSQAVALLGRLRVNGANAVRDENVRLVQFGPGAVVIPQGPNFKPLEIFQERYFAGPSKRLTQFTHYGDAGLAAWAGRIGSFKLKRGYMATVAQRENGSGLSRCYVAQDGDLDVGRLPPTFETNIHFVRVFPWRWTTKKGIAGNIESGLNPGWLYNWNLDRNSTLDWEYIPIRQTRWWPGLDQDWRTRGSTQLLGYNEPDRPDQANMSVADAIGAWPDLLWPGLRVGAPAVSDGGLNWLYDFMGQADAAGLRVDFVPVHYYRCYGNPGDPAGTANQFYNFLKGIYDRVQRPLWVTEWNNGANWTSCPDPSFAQQEAAVEAMINMLENTPFVERYALYNWVEDVRRLKWDDGSLTAAGESYRDKVSAIAYQQQMADAGVGSSARYGFDGDAHDGWGNGQDGMFVGAPTFRAGRYGQAVELNGATDYIQVSPRMGDSADFSFAGWVFWNGGGSWQRIFDFGDDTSHYLFLSPRSGGGSLRFAINNGGGEQQLSAPALATGVWTHVAITINGNTGKLFVNGAPMATNASMSIDPLEVGTKFNFLGKSRFPADPLFSGRFDDFRFISSALTDVQVAAIYNTKPPQFRAATLYKPDAATAQPYTATLAGDAIGAGPLTFSKMAGPAWLAVGANGGLSGTPDVVNGGINTFLVRVMDTNGSLHTATVLIVVPTVSMTVSVASGDDDAEESAAGDVNVTSTDLELANDDASGAGNQLIGLRFNDISIPPGAIITNASIQFTADEAQSQTAVLAISVEAADDAAPFAATANNLGARARLPLSVPWTPAAWIAGQSNAAQRTPNVAGLMQAIISRPGWAAGNSIVFLISGTGHRTADAFDDPGGFPARLTLHYIMSAPVQTVSATITASGDDAEQSSAGAVTLDSTDLELVNDGALGDQIVGLRFDGIALPPGALVTGADIQFTADEAQSESTALTLRVEAGANADAFTIDANDLGARPMTVASIAWSPLAWAAPGERGPLQRTPDLGSLVREVISRPDWASGNAMAFLITGTGHRTAEANDKAGGTPPTLTINYVPGLPLGSYARWSASNHNIGPASADLDADGYNNFVEYALGLDPAVPDRPVTSVAIEGARLHFHYTRPSEVIDVTYRVEWTDAVDSAAWSSVGATQHILSDDGFRRTIRVTLPRAATGQRFVRLTVES